MAELGVVNKENKTLLKSYGLHQYILETTVFPREPECLRELRLITAEHPRGMMASSPDQAQFLGVLLNVLNAKKTIEVGVFTGYSVLATALAIPDDGKIVAIDLDDRDFQLGFPVIQKAGVAHKVDFRHGTAMAVLDQLIAEEKNIGSFDFAFVDADKINYLSYHERLLSLVRIGGIIAYDNTLWGGTVAVPPEELPQSERSRAELTRGFNTAIAADRRVQVCQLSIADGVTLCRRLS